MNAASGSKLVMVGVDGSVSTDNAMAWAVEHARTVGAEIVAVHVLTYNEEFNRDISVAHTVAFYRQTSWRRLLRDQLENEWTKPARDAGIPTRSRLVEANTTSEGLLRAAEIESPDLIVVGTHSHPSLADRLLHSTIYRVLHTAEQPVVVIPLTRSQRSRPPESEATKDVVPNDEEQLADKGARR